MTPSVTMVGGYEPEYPRVDVMIQGCRANGVTLEHAHVEPGNGRQRKTRLRRLLRTRPITTDFALVPSFCHHEVRVVRSFFEGPIVFDPLVSRYMTKILDYRRAGRFSVHALINYLADRTSLRTASFVLSDTRAHKEYYCRAYGVSPSKVEALYVGFNADDFAPRQHAHGPAVTIGFYGSFIPLHGIDTILRAADVLRERHGLQFELAGSGHTFREMERLSRRLRLGNVTFCGHVPYRDLCATINRWDICLGIFGRTQKTSLVIPNKVYHYTACGRPVITRDTPAIREAFTPDEDIVLCEEGPEALAAAIVRLVENRAFAERVADQGRRLVHERYSHSAIGRRLAELLEGWWESHIPGMPG